jgi:hypothetical protein
MTIINQYSMIWSAVIIVGLAGFFLLRKGVTLRRLLIVLGTGAVFFGGWLTLRPDPASTNNLNDFQAELGNGVTILLELQSPF